MANTKEALAIVLDVGPSMNQAAPGSATFLQAALEAITAILQRKLFAESKDEVTLVLCGTPDTANELADGESYENITLARPLGVVNWDLLNYIENDVQPSTVSGDFLDALVVAMDAVIKGIEGKRGFGSKRVILFSDVGGEFGDDQINDIVASMKEADIEFNVIGPSLDDDEEDTKPGTGGASNGTAKEKTAQQKAGEAMLRHIIECVDGESYSFSEALPALSFFQSRQVRSVAWKAQMEIGSNLKIAVAGYQRIKEAKAKGFKQVYAQDAEAEVERVRTYHLNDEDRTEVQKEDTVEGHRYGSTLVPFSSDDKEAFKFETEKGLKVLGFTKMEFVKRHQLLGDSTMMFTAEKGDQAATVALSAFINAMYETNTCAIVRRVYAKNSKVQLGCLVPHIKAKYECLFYNEVPYAEDVRQYTFSSLPVRDDSEINKKLKPTDQQCELMDQLITSMDLTKKDEDGDVEELMKPKLTFNPYLQRLYQCLQHRAGNPDDALPELNPTIANYLKPPTEVQTQAQPVIDKMKESFKLVQVQKKKKDEAGQDVFKDDQAAAEEPAAKKQKVEGEDDLQGGMADLVKPKVTEVGSVNPVEDFRAIVRDKEEDKFEEACKQLQKRLVEIVMDSFGSQSYGKAMDCLKALREESVKNSEPENFNTFLREIKATLKDKGRKDFWDEVVTEKLSLVHTGECSDSAVTQSESDAFLQEVHDNKQEVPKQEEQQDADDLLDDF